ncbi:MAG: hypothetical protein LLG02_06245 [Pelosinus sp.]|nr:hypothetical protein [Pelosinus sp.]
MKKKLLALAIGTMLAASSTAFAAPLTNVEEGQTSIGYNHYNLSHDLKDDAFHIEHGLSSKFNIGVERNGYSQNGGDAHSTDVYVQYKLDPNVRLTLGNRDNSNTDSNKIFYGIGATVNLSSKVDGYAAVTTNSDETDWQAGINYNLDNKTALHLGYKSIKPDGGTTYDGIGFGVSTKL